MVLSSTLRATKCVLFVIFNFVALCHGAVKDFGIPKAVHDFPFYNSFLDAYRQTVDAVVSSHINIWNFNQRYKSFDESTVDGQCESRYDAHRFSSIPSFERDQQRTKSSQRTREGGSNSTDTAGEAPNKIDLDNESDIDMYFTHLKHACSQDIDDDEYGANLYQTECLDMLRSIVYDPRCTTRYDSRVKCKNDDTDYDIKSKSPGGIIQEHFREDSLNIVIVGAGPAGLLLANALSMLERANSDIPPIRILMLETRAEASGLKKPYTRNWQVMLRPLSFRYTIDPRVGAILTSTTDYKGNIDEADDAFASPLNLIETLLLLSNRDLGATKFLFGVNPLDLVDDLERIPNLLLVDATGHRLEPLKRGTSCDAKDEGITVIENFRMPDPVKLPWQNERESYLYDQMKRYWYPPGDYEIVRSHGLRVDIGQTGDVLYPIDEKTKYAKAIFWLEIHGALQCTDEEAFEEERLAKKLYSNEGQFCARCKKVFEDEDASGYTEQHEDVDGDEDDNKSEEEHEEEHEEGDASEYEEQHGDIDGDEDDDESEQEQEQEQEEENEEEYEERHEDIDGDEDEREQEHEHEEEHEEEYEERHEDIDGGDEDEDESEQEHEHEEEYEERHEDIGDDEDEDESESEQEQENEEEYEEWHEDIDGDEDEDESEQEHEEANASEHEEQHEDASDDGGDEGDGYDENEEEDDDESEDEEQHEDGDDDNDDKDEDEEEIDIRGFCDEMCTTEYNFDSTNFLREDIRSQIRKGRFSKTFLAEKPTDDAWFPLNEYLFNPSTELAQQVEMVLRKHGYSRHQVGMPLKDLLPAILQNIEEKNAVLSDEDWALVEAMRRIEQRNNVNSKWPTVRLYAQLPFLYQEGIKPKNKDHGGKSFSLGDYLDNAPMIRLGDSFTIGDGPHGSGIMTHVFMIDLFMNAIKAEWGENAAHVAIV